MSDEDGIDNVIHVSFSDGGRRLPPREPAASEPDPRAERRQRGDRRPDPLADLYSRREVSRLFGYTESRLRYWERSGFIEPSARSGRRRYYTFQDLISIRAAKGLLDRGVPLSMVRRSVEALRQSLPRVASPLSELRVVADGAAVVVKDRFGAFEPVTGQSVLDFQVESLRDDVVRVLHAEPNPERRRNAYEHYLEGCRLDEDEGTFDQAEEAYRRAIAADPSLANALTNLGNLRYRRGSPDEAEQLYRRALSVDPEQPEAFYNLGFLCFERGDPDDAIGYFKRALAHDPGFGDAHFNLAMAYEQIARSDLARPHWRAYLDIEPDGSWAEIARRHLKQQR